MLGGFQVTSVFQKGRDAGGPGRAAGDLRRVEGGILCPALDHLQGVVGKQAFAGELPGPPFQGLEEGRTALFANLCFLNVGIEVLPSPSGGRARSGAAPLFQQADFPAAPSLEVVAYVQTAHGRDPGEGARSHARRHLRLRPGERRGAPIAVGRLGQLWEKSVSW